MGRLDGKVALVTGASSGLGRAAALRFVREGARVLLADIDAAGANEALAQVPGELRANAHFHALDVTREEDCQGAVDAAVRRWGQLDIALANAGIGAPGALATLSRVDWERVLAVNLTGVFLTTRAAFRTMQSRGGSLLVMSSVAGLEGTPGLGAYGAAKAGVLQLVKTLALEGARFRIRANAVCPVWTETPMVDSFVKLMGLGPEAGRARLRKDIPLGRLASPDDVANACLYLASDEASFVTGITLPVDGGHTAGRTPAG
jgi:meso-butanediol dehydrogenase / (S,S)-butanediol dehydrogenase / diacetyl reductase